MKRRQFTARLLGTALCASALGTLGPLSGCGFQLRRAQPLRFNRVALVGFATYSPMVIELRHAIESTGTTAVTEGINTAQVVLRALLDAREQVVAGTTAAALVREVTLRTRLRFRLTTPDEERVLIPDTELAQSRDMSYTETNALAKQQEAELLYRAMQADIVEQVMRRLSAVVL